MRYILNFNIKDRLMAITFLSGVHSGDGYKDICYDSKSMSYYYKDIYILGNDRREIKEGISLPIKPFW